MKLAVVALGRPLDSFHTTTSQSLLTQENDFGRSTMFDPHLGQVATGVPPGVS